MSGRRNLYLRAAEGDEEAERAVLAELRRKYSPDEEVVQFSRGELAVRRVGFAVASAADGDQGAREALAEVQV